MARVQINISKKQKAALKKRAEDAGMNVSQYANALIKKACRKNSKYHYDFSKPMCTPKSNETFVAIQMTPYNKKRLYEFVEGKEITKAQFLRTVLFSDVDIEGGAAVTPIHEDKVIHHAPMARVRISTDIPAEEGLRFDAVARSCGMSRSMMARTAIREFEANHPELFDEDAPSPEPTGAPDPTPCSCSCKNGDGNWEEVADAITALVKAMTKNA